MTEMTKPIRELLYAVKPVGNGRTTSRTFADLKKTLSTKPILALYDPKLVTLVSADASSYCLEAVLTRNGEFQPVAYISWAKTTICPD